MECREVKSFNFVLMRSAVLRSHGDKERNNCKIESVRDSGIEINVEANATNKIRL